MRGVHPDLINPGYSHKVLVPPDDGEEIVFKWHWPRNTLRNRMSAYEIAQFILPHMPNLIYFFDGYNRVKEEFKIMTNILLTNEKKMIDEILPWIKSVTRTEDDDIIELQLFAKNNPEPGPKYFVMG